MLFRELWELPPALRPNDSHSTGWRVNSKTVVCSFLDQCFFNHIGQGLDVMSRWFNGQVAVHYSIAQEDRGPQAALGFRLDAP